MKTGFKTKYPSAAWEALASRVLGILIAFALAQALRTRAQTPGTGEASQTAPSSIVVPNGFELNPGNRALRIDGGLWITQAYSSSQFAPLASGGFINSISFRPDEGNQGVPFDVTYSTFRLQLATFPYSFDTLDQVARNVNENGLPRDFLPDTSVVFSRDGPLRLSGESSTSPTLPSPFDITIQFDKPFYYDAKAGNLVMLLLADGGNPSAGGLIDFHDATQLGFPAEIAFGINKSQDAGLVVQFGIQTVPEPEPTSIFLAGSLIIWLLAYGTPRKHS